MSSSPPPLIRPRALAALRDRTRRWSAPELGTLLALALAAAGLLGFVALVDEVAEGDTNAFDEAILHALRNPADPHDPVGPWWVESIMRDITALGGTTVLTVITLIAMGYLLIDGKRATAFFLLASVAGGTLVSNILKTAVGRPRPDLVAHLVEVRTLSFPSGHAMLSAAVFLTLGALLAGVQAKHRLKAYLLGVAVALTLVVGASRVYLGVHWPTDVLAGWCVGAAWAMMCWLAMQWLRRRGRVEREGADPHA